MRILWVKDGRPVAADQRRPDAEPADHLASCRAVMTVTVVTTHGDGDDPEGLVEQLSGCERVISFPYQVPKRGSAAFPIDRGALLAVAGSGGSVEVARARRSRVRERPRRRRPRRRVRRRLPVRRQRTCRSAARVPTVLFEHNVEYLIWKRLCDLETVAWRRALLDGRMAQASRARSRRLPRLPT